MSDPNPIKPINRQGSPPLGAKPGSGAELRVPPTELRSRQSSHSESDRKAAAAALTRTDNTWPELEAQWKAVDAMYKAHNMIGTPAAVNNPQDPEHALYRHVWGNVLQYAIHHDAWIGHHHKLRTAYDKAKARDTNEDRSTLITLLDDPLTQVIAHSKLEGSDRTLSDALSGALVELCSERIKHYSKLTEDAQDTHRDLIEEMQNQLFLVQNSLHGPNSLVTTLRTRRLNDFLNDSTNQERIKSLLADKSFDRSKLRSS